MSKYQEYKETGIKWLGKIPKHWNKVKLRYLADITTGDKDTENREDDAEYPFFVRSQTIERISSYTFDGEAILTAGDGVGVCKVWHYINGKFDFHQRVYMLSNFKGIDGKYLFLFLKENFIHEVLKLSAKSTVDSLRRPMFLDFPVSLPPFNEQTQIAKFLDYKTAQIDAIINKKEQLIEKLKLQRQAIINEAVTGKKIWNGKSWSKPKEVKESGIEGLGKIPQQWENSKIKYIAKINGRIGFKGYTKDDLVVRGQGALTLGAKHINKDNILDLTDPEFISWEKYYESPEIMVKKDDVIFTQRGSLGKVCHINSEIQEATINPSMVILNKIKILPRYLYFWLTSKCIQNEVELLQENTAVPMISQFQLSNFPIIFPDYKEQIFISKFIDDSLNNQKIIIDKNNVVVTKLKQYRQSLISEAVTGKIDLRDWKQPS